jgi:hypothetical protein
MYALTPEDNVVLRLEDNAFIPVDIRNRDYQRYLDWLEEGNKPTPLKTLPAD